MRAEKIRKRAQQRIQQADRHSRQSFVRTPSSYCTSRQYRGEHLRVPTEEPDSHYPLNLLKNQGIKARLRGKVDFNGPSLNRSLVEAGITSDDSHLFDGDFESSFEQFQKISRQRRSYNKRIPLLFLRPYSKANGRTRTLQDVKSELYSSVKRGELHINKRMLIEYYTAYGETDIRTAVTPSTSSVASGPLVDTIEKKKYVRPSACNIIRQKVLKKSYEKKVGLDSHPSTIANARICYLNNFLTLC